jgi:hypothetical protein
MLVIEKVHYNITERFPQGGVLFYDYKVVFLFPFVKIQIV